MRVLHISDTHLMDPSLPLEESLHYGRIDSLAALDGVLDRLASPDGEQFLGAIDVIVHSGDASEDGSTGSYRALIERLETFASAYAERRGAPAPPVAIAMGNHDNPAAFAEVAGWGDHAGTGAHGQRFQDRALEVPGAGRILVLDSSVPGVGWGMLEEPQWSWLESELQERDGRRLPTLIVLHHPPLRVASRLFQALSLGTERAGFGDGAEGEAYAARWADLVRGRAAAILSGHLHHELHGECGGVPVFVGPGTTNVVDPEAPHGAAEIERALPLSGVGVLDIRAGERAGAWQASAESLTWPNTGDTQPGSGPVYEFAAPTITRIVEAAGRG